MSDLPPDTVAPPPNIRLRPSPTPVIRLSRKALTIAGVVAATAVGGAFLLALQPPQAHPATAAEPTASPQAQRISDRLSSLPKTYGDVPQLGVPLPGDLGKPILDAQARNGVAAGGATAPAAFGPPANASPASSSNRPPDEGRTSALFAQTQSGTPPASYVGPAVTGADPYAALIQAAIGRGPDSPVATNASFINRPADQETVSPERLQAPASPYLLLAGTSIPAALMTGLKSDLPGLVTAQVSRDVYDSLRGAYLLIPKGSRLIGEYDSKITFGQQRVQLVWTRLILPNGKSLLLNREVAADRQGYSGLNDRTDFHWGGVFKAGLLSTTLAVGAQSGASDESDLSRAVRDGASDSISRMGHQIIERQLNIQPSLTIRPGFPVQVVVSRDLVLEPYGD